MAVFEIIFLAALGLVVGSFLNVVIDRTARNEQIIAGRSRCPHCRIPLRWYDLVPLFSFLALRGRCRYCGQKISRQYPLVELAAATGFAVIGGLNGFAFGETIALLGVFSTSLVIFIYDLKHLVIPDGFLIALSVFVLADTVFSARGTIELKILAALLMFGFFWLFYAGSAGRWLGGGDVKLGAIVGFWLGWPAALVALLGAYLVGLAVLTPFLLTRGLSLRSRIPFGPFLVVSSWIAFFWSEKIIEWYLSLLI